MSKRVIMALAGITAAFAAAVFTVEPVQAEALPCTYDIINDANAQIAAASAEVQAAEARLAAARANFSAVVATNPGELELTIAGNEVTNAENQLVWYKDQLNNARAYLDNITQRAIVEDNYDQAVTALGYLNNYQEVKLNADNAQGIANSALVAVQNVQNEIKGYEAMLATSPSLQSTIDALNVQLAVLTADYQAKQAVADAKALELSATIAADRYQSYDKSAIDYINHRFETANKPEEKCVYKDDVTECTPEKTKREIKREERRAKREKAKKNKGCSSN